MKWLNSDYDVPDLRFEKNNYALTYQCGSTLFFRSMGMYLQDQVPEEHLGSWWTASDAFARIFGLLGILIGGYVFDLIGGVAFCVVMGACIVVSGAGFLLTPLPTFSEKLREGL